MTMDKYAKSVHRFMRKSRKGMHVISKAMMRLIDDTKKYGVDDKSGARVFQFYLQILEVLRDSIYAYPQLLKFSSEKFDFLADYMKRTLGLDASPEEFEKFFNEFAQKQGGGEDEVH